MRVLYLTGWGYVAIAAALLYRASHQPDYAPVTAVAFAGGSPAEQWFQTVKPLCNALEVELTMQRNPAPEGWEGSGYAAACFALASKIARAQERIDALQGDDRVRATGIVFGVGHPVADAGDDESAGPIMELVLRYWPNHYMALYHAGIAEFRTGKRALARKNLEEFLRQYTQNDGWTASARSALKELGASEER
jgi:hypothetical protein